MATIRLQKVLARAGVASRRAAEAIILAGRVRVDGRIITEMGTKIEPRDSRVEVDGTRVVREEPVYVVIHKPRGVVSTMHDPEGRPSVRELLSQVPARVFPVGRLDYHTSGVLLATNDGEFTDALLHPRRLVAKTYVVKVQGVMGPKDLDTWRGGVDLEDGKTQPAKLKLLRHEGDKTWLEVTITEGRNQQIRRMGDATRFRVMRLARTAFAGVSSEALAPGRWRYLTSDELKELKKEYGVPKRIVSPPAPPKNTQRSVNTTDAHGRQTQARPGRPSPPHGFGGHDGADRPQRDEASRGGGSRSTSGGGAGGRPRRDEASRGSGSGSPRGGAGGRPQRDETSRGRRGSRSPSGGVDAGGRPQRDETSRGGGSGSPRGGAGGRPQRDETSRGRRGSRSPSGGVDAGGRPQRDETSRGRRGSRSPSGGVDAGGRPRRDEASPGGGSRSPRGGASGRPRRDEASRGGESRSPSRGAGGRPQRDEASRGGGSRSPSGGAGGRPQRDEASRVGGSRSPSGGAGGRPQRDEAAGGLRGDKPRGPGERSGPKTVAPRGKFRGPRRAR